MKRKNTLLGVGLLVAIIGLGIGYAIQAQELKVEGTATAQESATSFVVKFTDVTPTTAQTTTNGSDGILTSVLANKTSDNKATMEVTLTNLNDEVSASFTIQNASQKGLSAKIAPENIKIYSQGTTSEYSSDYFDVTHNINETKTIQSGTENELTFTVTVKLKKAFVSSDANNTVTENFDIVLTGITAVQE